MFQINVLFIIRGYSVTYIIVSLLNCSDYCWQSSMCILAKQQFKFSQLKMFARIALSTIITCQSVMNISCNTCILKLCNICKGHILPPSFFLKHIRRTIKNHWPPKRICLCGA